MGLSSAVKGARYIAQQITWTDEDGTAVNLTGATITGKLKLDGATTSTAIDGTLAVVTAASGIFSWAYGATDVSVAGTYIVQFTATYAGGLLERTLSTEWRVFDAL